MDRFFKGLISGMTGGLIMDLWGFFVKDLLAFSTRNYVDWTSVIIFGFLPTNWYEFSLAFLTHLLWTGFLGILLAYTLPHLTPTGTLIKGGFFGFILGFIMFGVAILTRMPFFTQIPFPTAAGNALGGILWGIITAQILKLFEVKFRR